MEQAQRLRRGVRRELCRRVSDMETAIQENQAMGFLQELEAEMKTEWNKLMEAQGEVLKLVGEEQEEDEERVIEDVRNRYLEVRKRFSTHKEESIKVVNESNNDNVSTNSNENASVASGNQTCYGRESKLRCYGRPRKITDSKKSLKFIFFNAKKKK
ncbi:PREDICTED: uncharacterized protein LOC106813041 [Priapulus caudatus]|uniref:Uncharacterized protein LOC106813041 n=1 Tax=Priapulus caudatus TaxID=37621 RepID=A0ABM1EK52_PRICU|nr:PREDICTED: uncharacterized protein LOC106813041 [Priapulus caudatus]XP_014672573.1 PREDICTED: uncharacterized protein LOC106813041 [Priapulus caudatus]